MSPRPARSLKHEYELYVEQEIEDYKESVARNVLLGIGDEAVAALAKQSQLALTEMVLCEEVDRLIVRRLRLPSYATWRRRRMKLQDEIRRPEHWGLTAEDVLVRAFQRTTEHSDARVLVAGARDEAPTLYLAANGRQVTALTAEEEVLERVVAAAIQAGLAERVHAEVGDLTSWHPHGPLTGVVVTPAALAELAPRDRMRVIGLLQKATVDGGVHLVRTLASSSAGGAAEEDGAKRAMTLDELRSTYSGWEVSVERLDGVHRSFLARKSVA